MIPFVRDQEGIAARLSATETSILRNLCGQLAELLDDPGAMDAALARLLPDAYLEDPAAASEHRRLTERGLIDGKLHNAQRVRADLGATEGALTIRLDEASVQAWLRTLTDLRLTLASRLEILEDGDPGLVEDEDDAARLAVYDWLGYLQESLVGCLSTALDDRDARA